MKKPYKLTIHWQQTEPWTQRKSFATIEEAEAFILGVSMCFSAVGDGDYEIECNWDRKKLQTNG